MAVDLGKQVGPLPLGAWLAVVAGGLGIAWYTSRTKEPVVVEDTSGTPGVGVGAPAPWTPIEGTPAPGQQQPPAPTTNEQWAQKAISWLIGMGYPPTISDSAVRKYIAGMRMGVQETTLIGQVLIAIGPPPQVLPPLEDEPTPPQPPPTQPPPTQPPPSTPPAPQMPLFASVPANYNIYQWCQETERAYGPGSYSYSKLIQLNPNASVLIKWGPGRDSTGSLIPVFPRGLTVRLRY